MGIFSKKIDAGDFYGFMASKLLEKARIQPKAEQDELNNVIMNVFLRRSNRKEDLLQKLDGKHLWIAEAIREGQTSWKQAHDGKLPMDLFQGEYAANFLNLENALTGNSPENFSDSGELIRK